MSEFSQLTFPIDSIKLIDYYAPTPFLSVPVISFFGLIDVSVYGSAGVGGSVTIDGYLQPLRPGSGVTMDATGKAHAELGVGLRLLMGLAEAGATARVDAELGIPLTVELLPEQHARLDACLTMRFTVRAFAAVLWESWDETEELAKFPAGQDPKCVNIIGGAALAADIEPTIPTLVAAPAIAVGMDGTQLSVYVENTTPTDAPARVQVLARFKTPTAATWSEPIACFPTLPTA